MYRTVLKRLIDMVLAFLGIVILIIPMGIVAVIIKVNSPGPVLFKQKRIGIHKSEFMIWKFRSMPEDAPSDIPTHQFDASEVKLTKWQKFIRKTSVDELPQLFNILIGNMSIIGPRPALWNQYDLIEERDKYGANDVRPGLSGWAQINGRDCIGIQEKAKFDGEYVKRMGFVFDCKCFVGTVFAVLKREGVIDGGKDTKAQIAEGEMVVK